MERMLIHGEGDRHSKPYHLLPWQREFNWRWFELDPEPDPFYYWYVEGLIGAERGAVKTEFLAGLAHLEMAGPAKIRREVTPIVHIAAASFDQAGELFRQAQIMAGGAKGEEIPTAPLFGLYDVFDAEILFHDVRPGFMARIAAVAGTNEGGKSTLFLADELAEWTGRKDRVFTVVSAALSKRTPPGRTLGISMAGAGKGETPPKDSDPLLWRLYARGLLEKNDPGSRFLMDWVQAAEHWNLDEPDQVRAALREMRGADKTWSVEVRAREILSRKIPRHEAIRLYLCRFIDVAVDSWQNEIPGVWQECADQAGAPPDGSEVVVGVDMALHRDSVGVVAAGVLPDGRVGWSPRNWTPQPRKNEHGATVMSIDHRDVVATIAGAMSQRWKIKAVVYDPRYFEIPASDLEDLGIATIEFPQSPERLVKADGLMYDLLVEHRFAHPDDPVLNAHSANAAWREGEAGRYLSKSKSGGHMDLIRAGAMATWELVAGEPNVAPATAKSDPAAPGDFFRPPARLDL
jgi:phage terminase large subunit-like protein